MRNSNPLTLLQGRLGVYNKKPFNPNENGLMGIE
jgi:hypothetical protein